MIEELRCGACGTSFKMDIDLFCTECGIKLPDLRPAEEEKPDIKTRRGPKPNKSILYETKLENFDMTKADAPLLSTTYRGNPIHKNKLKKKFKNWKRAKQKWKHDPWHIPIVGAISDMKMYHDGTNTYIKNIKRTPPKSTEKPYVTGGLVNISLRGILGFLSLTIGIPLLLVILTTI